MYYYQMFGLTVKSEFAIPEAVEIAPVAKTDIYMELGIPPKQDFEEARAGRIDRLEKEVAWFNLPGLGMFYVEHGEHVIVWKETKDLTDLSRNSYVTGSVMGLIMFQRGIIPIHSGGVAVNGGCVLVVGNTGAGKSTTCVMLRNKGCDFVTDDMAPVTVEDGVVMASPAFPQQKLCRDAAIRQGYDLEELIFIDEHRDKYAIRLKDHYVKEKLPLAMIVELEPTEETELSIRELRGLDKLKLLYRNIYRGKVWNQMGMEQKVQEDVLKIAENVPMYQIQRPMAGFYTEEITDWIMDTMKNKG